MNAAPAHLETKLRFGELTVGQIAAAFVGVLCGFAWASYVSPFGGLGGAISGAYIAGVPVAAAVVATQTDCALCGFLPASARWRGRDGPYLPGSGVNPRGYLVTTEAGADARDRQALPHD